MQKLMKGNKKWVLLIVLILSIFLISFTGNIIKMPVNSIVKYIEKARILNRVSDYDVYETDKFIIRHDNDTEIAELTANILNKYYDSVCSMFNYYPNNKIDVIIYNDGEELLENTRLKKDTPPLGVYYSGTISILSPRLWAGPDDIFQEVYEKQGPLVHEFTHLLVDNLTNGNYPLWLTEGVALYVEYETTGFEWGRNLTEHSHISIEDLNENFHNIDANLSYRKSFEIVRSISETWGFDKLRLLLDSLGEGNSMDKSTERILKVSLGDIEKNY